MSAHEARARPKAGGLVRQHLALLLKLLISAALVFALFYYNVISIEALRTTFRDPVVAVSAFAVLLVGYGLSALRWYYLLHAMGIAVRLRPCAEIFAMGTFATTFLPGGTGGDVVRAVYIARHVHQDRTGGVISVLADRAMGLLGVIAVAVLLGFVRAEQVIASPVTRTLFFILAAAFAVALLGLAGALALISPRRYERIKTLLGVRTLLQRIILRLFATLVQLRANPGAVLLSFVLSILITLTIVAAVIFLARGYEAGGLEPLDFANASVLALFANVVPITPGGVGVGEAAFAFLCYAWERTPSALAYGTIFFGQRLITTVISLIGSIAFVTYRGSIGRTWPPAEESAAAMPPRA
ncbi:MAG: lysylphosphatidylglycerol synthase transmembrane domain-containing protein [Xanthobacteraceae bacterium]